MDTIGIRQLREDLATYVTRARQGERLVVTDRGLPVAELVPVSEAVQGLLALVADGTLTWGGGKPVGARIAHQGPSMSEAISEDRR